MIVIGYPCVEEVRATTDRSVEGLRMKLNLMHSTVIACGLSVLGVAFIGIRSVQRHMADQNVPKVGQQDTGLILSPDWKVSTRSNGDTLVTGEMINRSSHDLESIQISFSGTDATGGSVATAVDTISKLPA